MPVGLLVHLAIAALDGCEQVQSFEQVADAGFRGFCAIGDPPAIAVAERKVGARIGRALVNLAGEMQGRVGMGVIEHAGDFRQQAVDLCGCGHLAASSADMTGDNALHRGDHAIGLAHWRLVHRLAAEQEATVHSGVHRAEHLVDAIGCGLPDQYAKAGRVGCIVENAAKIERIGHAPAVLQCRLHHRQPGFDDADAVDLAVGMGGCGREPE